LSTLEVWNVLSVTINPRLERYEQQEDILERNRRA